ncbi:hypothetical protein ACN9MJ_13220 [Acidovorax facilis]|uniref:hypothetical protein n=1 Tax=Acidovorax facilis TaxID=12917 RepID=UPI003CEDDC71
MKTEIVMSVVKICAGLVTSAFLAGCGLMTFTHEAGKYQAEIADADLAAQVACSKNEVVGQIYDHRRPGELKPDCYLAVVTGESTVLQEPAPSPLPYQKVLKTGQVLRPSELARTTDVQIIIGQVAWPALLSKVVYRRHVEIENRYGRAACTYQEDIHPLRTLNARANLGPDESRWEPWQLGKGGCNAVGGLFYETFVNRQYAGNVAGRATQAMVVFRGTENYRGQILTDWSTNAAMAFNISPSQFKHVRDEMPNLVAALKAQEGTDLQIFAAGHSLGGSLAQLAVYVEPAITSAYAFNTSPVNGWTWLRREGGVKRDDPQIIRVSQGGEFLTYLRNYTNAANSFVRRTGRMDIVFDFPASRDVNIVTGAGKLNGATSLHSINLLACNLAARVAMGTPAAFDFTKKLAVRAIEPQLPTRATLMPSGAQQNKLEIEGLCDVPNLPSNCKVNWIDGRVEECPEADQAHAVTKAR